MKNLLIAISLMVSFTAQAHDVIEHDQEVYGASIIEMELNHEYLKDTTTGGSIDINKTANTIKLTLFQKINCPKGMACIALAPAPVIIELPIVASYSDWCGSVTYEAVRDMSPVDGLKETLVVTDYTNMTCRIALPYGSLITYDAFNPWANDSVTSEFQGSRFRLLPTFF